MQLELIIYSLIGIGFLIWFALKRKEDYEDSMGKTLEK